MFSFTNFTNFFQTTDFTEGAWKLRDFLHHCGEIKINLPKNGHKKTSPFKQRMRFIKKFGYALGVKAV
ncbi:hypothetical protein BCY91_11920 [Pelobium manganitolerans]|uniref:Uncharacterized protein n=1 Tax=Pelobium manganitolerans TaxID=1842495 RepID=A0A419S1J4_9SPHI|nr:hypothetical protein BCY91_11920 [Pelobium manganitolerans]